MVQDTKAFYLDEEQRDLIINYLVTFKSRLKREFGYYAPRTVGVMTDELDELLEMFNDNR